MTVEAGEVERALPGRFLDGRSAAVNAVTVSVDTGPGQSLILTHGDGGEIRWPLSTIRRVPDQPVAGDLALMSTDTPLARLYIAEGGIVDDLKALAPALDQPQPVRGRRRVAAWALGAFASVFLIIFGLVPILANQLATVLPAEGEKALGDATLEQVRRAFGDSDFMDLEICEAPEGVAALQAIADRVIGDTELPYDLTVTVLDHDLLNAFALPGGHVVFFRGLIDAANDPDEVAAVFAHELGHVVARDPVRIALRTAGSIGVLGLLFGDFAGGAVVLFLTERLIQADYTRAAEEAADTFAHDRLIEVGIRPDALAGLFETLRAEYGDTAGLVAHFMSHPELGDRIEAAQRAAEAANTTFRPSLTRAQWRALQAICE